jgi:hypothetical protein
MRPRFDATLWVGLEARVLTISATLTEHGLKKLEIVPSSTSMSKGGCIAPFVWFPAFD